MIGAEAHARLQALERQVAQMAAQQPAPAPLPPQDRAQPPRRFTNGEEFALEHIAAIKDRLQGFRKEGETVLAAVSRLVAEVRECREIRSKSKLHSH